ncbi:MAG TPA: hypothetical protein VGO58_19750 [Chitinophagaceae bacterium]|nr:hypothetical protein [Chitinophagaceae bacterium]
MTRMREAVPSTRAPNRILISNEGVADGTPNPDQMSKEKENPKPGRAG